MDRRDFLKKTFHYTAAYAGIRCADFVIGRSQTLPEIKSYSDDFMDVLAFMKTQTNLVCIGDTDHREKGLFLLLHNKENLDRLDALGFEKVFLEIPDEYQVRLDNLKKGIPDTKDSMFASGWGIDRLEKELVQIGNDSFLNHQKPSLIAADHRLQQMIDTDYKPKPIIKQLLKFGQFGHDYILPESTSIGLWTAPFFVLDILLKGCSKEAFAFLQNDEGTIENISNEMLNTNGAGLVVFGAGHFQLKAEENGLKSLYTGLKEKGYNPLVVSLFYNPYHAIKTSVTSKNPADIDFILTHDGKHKIVFNNKPLERAYIAHQETTNPTKKNPQISRRNLLRMNFS